MPQYDRGASGGGVFQQTTSVLTSDFTPSTHATYEDSGLSVDVTTSENEVALVHFSGNVYADTADYLQFFVQILDGATVILERYFFLGTAVVNTRAPIDMAVYHTFAEGTNTVKVQFKYQTSGQVNIMKGGDENFDQRCRLQVVQIG